MTFTIPRGVVIALAALLLMGAGAAGALYLTEELDEDDEKAERRSERAAGTGKKPRAVSGRRFAERKFAITFRYPRSFDKLETAFHRSAGRSPAAEASVGLDADNVIAVQRFDLDLSVNHGNLDDVRPEADDLFSRLAGRPVEGKKLTIGGMPGLKYRIKLDQPRRGRTLALMVFQGPTQYLLSCQSTPGKRAEMKKACALVVDTLKPR